MSVAIGAQTLFAIGRESAQGIPAGSLVFHKPVLPLAPFLNRTEAPGNEMNAEGFMEAGVPNAIAGPFDVGIRFSAAHILEFLEALGFEAAKSTLTTGFYNYLFTPRRTFLQTLYAMYALDPVEKGYVHGILLNSINLAIANNGEIIARCQGQIAHGTRFGPAEADAGNTGTYALGPWLRGPLASDSAGRTIHLKIATVSPLAIKAEQTDGSPTFPGSAVAQLLDADGNAIWMNQQGATGLDLGFWAENKDTLDSIFPGGATEHGDLDADDIFTSTLDWDNPTPTYLSGQRFTSAHALLRKRNVGAGTWDERTFVSGAINTAWPAVPEPQNSSRYPRRVNREGALACGYQLVSRYENLEDVERNEAHRRMETQVEFQGAQFNATYRHGVLFDYPYASLATVARPVANAGAIQQTTTVRGEADPDGSPPMTIRVRTDRDWTPSTGF